MLGNIQGILDAYSQHWITTLPLLKSIPHTWKRYCVKYVFWLDSHVSEMLLVPYLLQGKTFWPYWYRIKMNFNFLAISNTSMVWTPPQDEGYWILQYRIFLSGGIFNWTNRIIWLPSRSELSGQHKVKYEAFLNVFPLLHDLPNPPATRDFFYSKKGKCNFKSY